ncbi:hypothetical protein Lepto7375DRAFT_4221 [Leptolyngbya sp. PCC 7375]|nr:hypothetical protein Lepto7375DRAFT_4221 [Leptolyngbya sp. PCC 7375]
MPKLLDKDASYTFRSYFEMPYDTDEVLAEFGYGYTQTRLHLPKTNKTLSGLDQLKIQIEETLPYVQLTSESAKREVLVAPVLTRVATLCHQVLRFEYSLKVSNWLQGNLGYLIRAQHQVIVVEAKRDDLTRGFTQLAVEMIALATVDDAPSKIYGAVTMGSLWIFGALDQAEKMITQDIGGYRVPDDVEDLVRVLVGILEG